MTRPGAIQTRAKVRGRCCPELRESTPLITQVASARDFERSDFTPNAAALRSRRFYGSRLRHKQSSLRGEHQSICAVKSHTRALSTLQIQNMKALSALETLHWFCCYATHDRAMCPRNEIFSVQNFLGGNTATQRKRFRHHAPVSGDRA